MSFGPRFRRQLAILAFLTRALPVVLGIAAAAAAFGILRRF